MAWEGYFEYAGSEFINVARTEAYAGNAYWFRAQYKNTDLPVMLGDGERYVSPLIDEAPWTDPDVPESYDFFGAYPLSITGLEDSTRDSQVTESINDGGTPGRVRHNTREAVFEVALIGASECAVEYGMKWLRQLLIGSACGSLATNLCNGADLCFLKCEPALDWSGSSPSAGAMELLAGGDADDEGEPYDGGTVSGGGAVTYDGCDPILSCMAVDDTTVEDCLHEYMRTYRSVVFNNGPSVTAKRALSDGSVTYVVTFTAVAGNPHEFGIERPVVSGFMDPAVTNPYAPGLSGMIDLDGEIIDDSSCGTPVYTPVYDPLCPALIAPPGPPSLVMGCYEPPANWRRRQFSIPKELIPLWHEAVPLIRVNAGDAEVRNLRLRFYADVNGDGSVADEDPCAYCGDIVISYVPADSTLVFDGSDQVIYVETAGGVRRRADSLVFRTDGLPFDWPALSCGFGYVVTLDLPQTQATPSVDLSLFNRVAA